MHRACNVTRLSTRAHKIRGKSVGVAADWIIHNVEAAYSCHFAVQNTPRVFPCKTPLLYIPCLLATLPSFVPTFASFSPWAELYTGKPHKKSFNAIGSIRTMENFQAFFLVFHG